MLVAHIAVLFQRFVDDIFKPQRDIRVQANGGYRGAVQDRVMEEGGGVAIERHPPRGHLIQHRAKRKQIGARIQFFPARLFGGHVGESTHDCSGVGGEGDGSRILFRNRN
jgi:hypothetical protein